MTDLFDVDTALDPHGVMRVRVTFDSDAVGIDPAYARELAFRLMDAADKIDPPEWRKWGAASDSSTKRTRRSRKSS